MPRLITLPAILAAIACRAWLHFTTALVPGMNGGYYLVQARSLIEKGSLGIPDLPLVFTLHSLLARLVHAVSSLDLNSSVMLAVKLGDSILPPLAIIAVMLLGLGWSRNNGGSKLDRALAALAGIGIVAGPAALSMVGEFEKNSLGLALLCCLAWAMRRWAARPGLQTGLTAVAFLGLIGITHIGVFGTALIFAASTFGALALAQGREGLARVGRLLLFAVPVAAAAGALVFWKFDPSRITKLLHAFSEPADYLAGGMGPPGMGMGPPGMDAGWMQWLPGLLVALLVLIAAAVAWFGSRDESRANVAVISGAALTVIALTGPWVHGDKVMRFYLNATPLTVLCVLYAVLHVRRTWVRGVLGVLLLGGYLGVGSFQLARGGRPIISEEAQAELKTLAPLVKDPASTLIVARHGLEWWTAWTLHTHIAQAQALSSQDWKKFKEVWFIQPKGNMGPGGFGPPQGGPEGRRGPGESPGILGFLMGGGRPPQRMQGPPPGIGGMGRPPGGGPGGMMGAPIPEDAYILHDGAHFTLARVAAPPEFVIARERSPLDPFGEWDALVR